MSSARASGLLGGPAAPWVAGVITAVAVWISWGSLTSLPYYHDEKAQLLQAGIFARGRFALESPPIPEFFEQSAIVVTPVLTPKAPPGQSLLLVPGVLIGSPGAIPVLLSGLTGALLFALVRRGSSPWAAALALVLWLSGAKNLAWHSSYMSPVTTSAAWLLGWWLLDRWVQTDRRRFLLALSLVVAWGAITRPLTMIAFALPAGVVVLVHAARRSAWRELAVAAAAGACVLAIVPLWSWRTTGDPFLTPLAVYTRQYMPWDVPGFSFVSTPPERPLPPDLQAAAAYYEDAHRGYTFASVPAALSARVVAIVGDAFPGWRAFALPFLVVGALSLSPPGWVALSTTILLILFYATYAHAPDWTVYYLETFPVLAGVAAIGFWRTLLALGAAIARDRGGMIAARIAAVLLLLALPVAASEVWAARLVTQDGLAYQRFFTGLLDRIPEERALVFVRYGPAHWPHSALVQNEPDPEHARRWVVHDRGHQNLELMRLVPDRTPYLLDEQSGRLQRLAPARS